MTVPLLPNGLLDLSKTPDHLIPTVQHNATKSPLLRLPAEIRSNIFQYATSGTEFVIEPVNQGHGRKVSIDDLSGRNTTDLRRIGMYLPQVSRQIYSETATLVFENNIFALEPLPLALNPYGSSNPYGYSDRRERYELLPRFISALIPAQRASIRELKFTGLNHHIPLIICFRDREPALTADFPNLEVVWLKAGSEKYLSRLARCLSNRGEPDIVNYGEHKRVGIAFY
ncbi:beta transducin [Didymosphaeria variabile]|uniref:Beta transducin n=1 Tax=Didymosphaeria variabile TaxID=1932322 RepID=A0A9W8XAQ8_9PLEO|nr:beta transducin [Didymosphaeria variabile]KAJ4345845.1 beta transducin [Didymosphaeria variabile]